MPKSGEVGTPKWISKQLKRKGLEKLKFYCQFCEKQCRDANGYKLHVASPSHLAKRQQHDQDGSMAKWSKIFANEFMYLLKTFPRKPISANKVYNELIKDKDHIHLNSTRWRSLRSFINHLKDENLIEIHSDTELLISYKELRQDNKAEEAKIKKEEEEKTQVALLERQRARIDEENKEELEEVHEPVVKKPSKISFSLKKK